MKGQNALWEDIFDGQQSSQCSISQTNKVYWTQEDIISWGNCSRFLRGSGVHVQIHVQILCAFCCCLVLLCIYHVLPCICLINYVMMMIMKLWNATCLVWMSYFFFNNPIIISTLNSCKFTSIVLHRVRVTVSCCQACNSYTFSWPYHSCTLKIALVASKIPYHVQNFDSNVQMYSRIGTTIFTRTHTGI